MRKAYDKWILSLTASLLSWARNSNDVSYEEYKQMVQHYEGAMAERDEWLKGESK